MIFISLLGFQGCGPEKTLKAKSKEGLPAYNWSLAGSYGEFEQKYSLEYDWISGPESGFSVKNKILLKIASREEKPVNIEYLDFFVFMKIHDHGGVDKNREIAFYQQNDVLVYAVELSEFFFNMPGPWELNLKMIIDQKTYVFELPINVE